MLTIGQMPKICEVSIKMLRHYEKIGLLRPRRTDEANGYRYYEDSQIGTMLLIGRLKWYEFSLTGIQGLLDTKDAGSLLGQLRRQKFRLERQMNYLSVMVREMGIHLEEFERTGDVMSYQNDYEIQVKETEEQVPVTSRQNMSTGEFGGYYGKLYEKTVREYFTANGITMVVYHDQEFDPACGDIEFAVGITKRDKADCIMPKCFCAATVHKGAYPGLPDAYGVVVSWINANGCRPDGVPHEIYVKNHFYNLPPEEWETEIFLPVKKWSQVYPEEPASKRKPAPGLQQTVCM